MRVDSVHSLECDRRVVEFGGTSDRLVQQVGVVAQQLTLLPLLLLDQVLFLLVERRVGKKVVKDLFKQERSLHLHVGEIGKDDDGSRFDGESVSCLQEEDDFGGSKQVAMNAFGGA